MGVFCPLRGSRFSKICKITGCRFVQSYKYKQTFKNAIDKYAFVYYYWGI